MVKQIKDLTAYQVLTKKILNTIASGSEQTPNIIISLQAGESLANIVRFLSGLTHEQSDVNMENAVSPGNLTYSAADDQDIARELLISKGFPWTPVASDQQVFQHLLSLYFAWIHPIYTLFDEGIFVKEYQTNSERHCSQALVNAICAMACHLHTKLEESLIDYESLGTLFMNAARTLVRPEIEDLTTVQTLAVMFLVDYSRGKGHRASLYLSMATRILSRIKLPLQHDCPENCSKDTLCGIQNLNV